MKFLKSGFLVSATNIVDLACAFLRNALLARLLTVENFGIVATFTLLISLLDMTQASGLNRMVVQARDADDPRVQATVHTVQLVLGAAAAGLLIVLSWPYAYLIGTPQALSAYFLLALVPLMRGLVNLDCERLQRHGRFGPWATRQITPPLISLVVIYPAYLWLRDYRTVLVIIYAQQFSYLIASHMGAERRFAFGADRDILRRAAAFGWPLMLNSLLLYFVMNGDRIIVSNRFGLEALGWFSTAVMLTLLPMSFIARTMQTLLLPNMARQQDNPVRLQRQYDLAISLLAIAGMGFVIAVSLIGGHVLVAAFGRKYAPAEPFLVLLSIMQAFRLLRAAPALAALAKAETKNALYTNVVRGVFVLLSLAVAILTHDIFLMLAVGICGEIAATLFGAWLANRMVSLSSRHFDFVLLTQVIGSGAVAMVSLKGWPIWILVPSAALFLYSVRGFFFHAREVVRR